MSIEELEFAIFLLYNLKCVPKFLSSLNSYYLSSNSVLFYYSYWISTERLLSLNSYLVY